MDKNRIRQIVLESFRDEEKTSEGNIGIDAMIDRIAEKIDPEHTAMWNAARSGIVACVNELLHNATLGLGNNVSGSWTFGSCHFTEQGKKTLEHLSRDPINQSGYLAYLDKEVSLDQTTRGYVEEAIRTYYACCYKAAAILIGAAVENLVLDLRVTLVPRLKTKGYTVSREMEGWQIKSVIEAIADRIIPDLQSDVGKNKTDDILRKLQEDADCRLHPIAAEFRRLRNSAGHPASLEPVIPSDVHSNLLMFPSSAKLLIALKHWSANYYV